MSYWKKILENDLNEITGLYYAKLNCVQQAIADLFQKESLTPLEVELILMAMLDRSMLDGNVANRLYRAKNRQIMKFEGVE